MLKRFYLLGCRYGCICHLYKFSEKDSEKEDSDHKPPCDKEYCRLGCICDSIDTKTEDQSHCRKPDCMFGCKCKPKTGSQETGEKHKEKRRSKDGGQQKGKKRSRKKKPQSRKVLCFNTHMLLPELVVLELIFYSKTEFSFEVKQLMERNHWHTY